MARKKTIRRARRRPSFKKASRRKARSIMGGMTGKLVAAGAYGAVRGRLTQFVSPFAAKLPLGGISDEVGTMAALWAAKRFIGNKVPMVRQMADSGMLIEASQIGQALATGGLNMGATKAVGTTQAGQSNLFDGGV